MVEMEDAFDSVVIGTGLGEALLSAALSAAGHSVLHLEPGSGYGRADGAMSLDRLIEFISSPDGALAGFGNVSISPTTSSLYDSVKGSGAKGFTLELAPKLLPARGALVETLIRSGVGRYVEFRGLQGIHILLSDAFEKVPQTKEDVFANEGIPLIEKRRLMKFMTRAMSQDEPMDAIAEEQSFEDLLRAQQLSDRSIAMLSHAIALNLKPPSSFSAREGLEKTMRHMTSLGRYCKTGSLVGMYGAGSELVQGFCRHSAVHGGVFRLNMPLNGVEVSEDLEGYKFTVDAGQGEDRSVYRAKHLIASTDFAPSLQLTVETTKISRAIVIRETVLVEDSVTDLFILPPGRFGESGIVVMQMGPEIGTCPEPYFTLYFAGHVTQEELSKAIEFVTASGPSVLCIQYTQSVPTGPLSSQDKDSTDIAWCSTSDSLFDLEGVLAKAEAQFARLCPGAPFFPPVDAELAEAS